MIVSFRMPEDWRNKVTDHQLAVWLREYAAKRPALPADPGTGPFRRSFRLSGSDKRLLDHVAGGDVSSFLRRLITHRLGCRRTPQAHPAKPTLISPRSTLKPAAIRAEPIVSRRQTTENRPSAVRGPLPPALLSQACEGNGYSPMWRNGEWIREPRTPEEDRAYQQYLESRLRQEQRSSMPTE